jgi:hypothetical protein
MGIFARSGRLASKTDTIGIFAVVAGVFEPVGLEHLLHGNRVAREQARGADSGPLKIPYGSVLRREIRSYVGPLTKPPTIFKAAPFSMALMVVMADDAEM